MAGRARAEHCLHLFDLATLAAMRAKDPGFARLYLVEVDHGGEGPPLATLSQDGEALLSWRIRGGVIAGSPVACREARCRKWWGRLRPGARAWHGPRSLPPRAAVNR